MSVIGQQGVGYFGNAMDERTELLEYRVRHLERVVEMRDRQIERSTHHWIRAAKLALQGSPQELANRVAMAEAAPVEIVTSEAPR